MWTEKEVHLERTEPDGELWEELTEKSANFHVTAIMLELIGRLFLSPNMPSHLTSRMDNIVQQVT